MLLFNANTTKKREKILIKQIKKALYYLPVIGLGLCTDMAMAEKTIASYTYSYDANGNTLAVSKAKSGVSNTQYTYAYNDLNQLVNFKNIQNNKTFTYAYYPNGKRLAKYGNDNNNTQTDIQFYYGHSGQLMNEAYSEHNQLQKTSSYFAGLRFVDDLNNANESHLQYPLSDRHNHPATINFSQNQTNIENYHLADYGKLDQASIGSNQTENSANSNMANTALFNFELSPKIYGSGYYDSESNLQYMGVRYYSADIQRFMAQDSYNLLNRYNYANGNPVMNYDPTGHYSAKQFAKDLKSYTIGDTKGSYIGFGVSVGVSILLGAGVGYSAMRTTSKIAEMAVVHSTKFSIMDGLLSGLIDASLKVSIDGHGINELSKKENLLQIGASGLIGGITSGLFQKMSISRSAENSFETEKGSRYFLNKKTGLSVRRYGLGRILQNIRKGRFTTESVNVNSLALYFNDKWDAYWATEFFLRGRKNRQGYTFKLIFHGESEQELIHASINELTMNRGNLLGNGDNPMLKIWGPFHLGEVSYNVSTKPKVGLYPAEFNEGFTAHMGHKITSVLL